MKKRLSGGQSGDNDAKVHGSSKYKMTKEMEKRICNRNIS